MNEVKQTSRAQMDGHGQIQNRKRGPYPFIFKIQRKCILTHTPDVYTETGWNKTGVTRFSSLFHFIFIPSTVVKNVKIKVLQCALKCAICYIFMIQELFMCVCVWLVLFLMYTRLARREDGMKKSKNLMILL